MANFSPVIAFTAILFCAWPAYGACYKEDIQGGLDRSLPCVFRSPLPFDIERVMFGQNSSDLDASARAILDQQAEILRQYPKLFFTVWGHQDHVEAKGPDGKALGFWRAMAVRDHLVARGIAPERISTDSRGDRWAIAMNPSEKFLAAMRFASTETEDNR